MNLDPTKELFPLHVRTVTGLEALLAQELTALGAKSVKSQRRLVTCEGDFELLYKANLWCRTAIRVLRPIASFPAKNEKDFYENIRKIDWSKWLRPTGTLAIDAHTHSSFSTHSLFVAQLTKDAIVDQFREKTGERPSVDLENPDLRINVSLYKDHAQIYIDTSGESLHKRGYRKKAGAAPLNEVLAAGILKLTAWNENIPLLDPMCGSGTFAIEAALIARNIAPGLLRKEFGFQRLPDYDKSLFARLVKGAKGLQGDSAATIVGIDKDPVAIEIAKQNLERAGLKTDAVRFEHADFFRWEPSFQTPGFIVANPPYDERLPVDNIAELFHKTGDTLKRSYGGWKVFVLSGNPEASKFIGLKPSREIVLYNGAIECRLHTYEIREGSRPVASESFEETALERHPRWKEKTEIFNNRLKKNWKHMSKWAERENLTCFRLYNWDIPELAFLVDIYGDRMHLSEIARNQEHSPLEHPAYIQWMIKTAGEALGIPEEKIYFKRRKPQKDFQYEKFSESGELFQVKEGGHRFLVNLSDYLDTGLFLDHRNARSLVEKEVGGKDFLNLFAYTGSFTVYAAAGGAKSTTTVDTSTTYLEWAEKNLALNDLSGPQHRFIRGDVFDFLHQDTRFYDLCIVDPPTRSVHRSSGRVFDVQKDHGELLKLISRRMRPGGKIYFSTNCRTFQLGADISGSEITSLTTPMDFKKKPGHRCWEILL